MRRMLVHCLVALVTVAVVASCSGGDESDAGSTNRPGQLRFAPLIRPPRPVDAPAVVDNADTVLALADSRLLRYDPWASSAGWIERERDLPSAKSRLVSWNDRVWYLTTDRGQLELVSVALSAEQRSDTRVVGGATDAGLAIFAARDAIYVLGADVGFRIDRDSVYSEFPGPPDRRLVADWATAQLAELTDGAIAVVAGQRLRWIFEPDLARWREPASGLGQRPVRSMAASDDGAYLLAGSPSQILGLVAVNRVEPVSSTLGDGCESAILSPTDLGLALVGCGTVTVEDAAGTQSVVAPAGSTIVRGPRGRPLAVNRAAGEMYLLERTP